MNDGVYTKLFFEALMKSEFGVSLSRVNGEVLLEYAAVSVHNNKYEVQIIPGADEKFRIRNGTDSVISALEAKFSSQIRLQNKVTAIKQLQPDQFEISVTSGGQSRKLNARHVVLAVPAYTLADINIQTPAISPKQLQEAATLPFGQNAKIFLTFREKFWDSAYRNNPWAFAGVGLTESGVQFWDTSENQAGRKGLITLYPGEWPTDIQERKVRLRSVLAELRSVPGLENLERYLEKTDVHNWQKSYAGVFNSAHPGGIRLFGENLAANIYFVGADKDNNRRGEISASYGYMNGAVRTANRAASGISRNQSRPIKRQCSVLMSLAG